MIDPAVLRERNPAFAAAYRASGAWRDRTSGDNLAASLTADPGRIVVIDGDFVLTVAQLAAKARSLAGWMQGRGVGAGDVISFQLPNWWEAFVIDAAICMLGAVSNPIVPIYRDAEVRFTLRDARAKLIFVPQAFRGFDYGAMLQRLRPQLPDLIDVVTVRGEGDVVFADVAAGPLLAHMPTVSADAARLLLYTSGTTGRAKGVVHTYNSLDSEVRTASGVWNIGAGDTVLMPSPLTHITGYVYGIMITEISGATTVLMDRWSTDEAMALIGRYDIAVLIAATTFLQELAAAARAQGDGLPSLRIFPCGGAPVAPELVRRATAAFANCAVSRVYGSTEAPTVTLGSTDRGSEIATNTDGIVAGAEVKIVDEEGRALPRGVEGEILTRGPELMAGYFRPEDNADAFDAEGYFRSGDLGVLTHDNAIIVTGRKKDMIIRGGENISAKEIEDLLHTHPAVHEVAVVAAPHERLGETVCAFVVPGEAGQHQQDLLDLLERHGLAKQKWPERFVFRDELPKTPAGKVKKFVLRDELLES